MPYHIEHKGGPRPFRIIRTADGVEVGSSVTMENARGTIAHRMDSEKAKAGTNAGFKTPTKPKSGEGK